MYDYFKGIVVITLASALLMVIILASTADNSKALYSNTKHQQMVAD